MSEVTKAKFDKAAQIVQSLPKGGPLEPTDNDKLFFYGYYKQATVGDVKEKRPALSISTLMDSANILQKMAKWDAWDSVKGTTAEVCYKMYVEKLIELLKGAGDPDSLKKVEEIEAA